MIIFTYLHTVYIQEYQSQTRILRVFNPAQTLKASLNSKCSTLEPSIEICIKCMVKHAPDYGPNTVFKFKRTSNQKHQSTNKQTVNDRPSLFSNNNINQSFITLLFPIY